MVLLRHIDNENAKVDFNLGHLPFLHLILADINSGDYTHFQKKMFNIILLNKTFVENNHKRKDNSFYDLKPLLSLVNVLIWYCNLGESVFLPGKNKQNRMSHTLYFKGG